MTPNDDQAWLDALAGRARGDSAATREAACMRDEMLHRNLVDAGEAAPGPNAAREAALIARARREGLIPPKHPARWGRPWSIAAAAAAAGFAIALGVLLRTGVDTELVRTSPDGVVRIEAPDPVAVKQQLIGELRAVGVAATGYELLGRQGIDADLPQPLPEDVRRTLDKHGIPPPRDGVLRVEIVQKEAR